jgi:hypothetical protein
VKESFVAIIAIAYGVFGDCAENFSSCTYLNTLAHDWAFCLSAPDTDFDYAAGLQRGLLQKATVLREHRGVELESQLRLTQLKQHATQL